jgi:GT2 family glycosyltransferase
LNQPTSAQVVPDRADPEAASTRTRASLGRSLSIVIVTKDRREELVANLPRLRSTFPDVHVVVVDNGSHDGTASTVRERFADVDVIDLGRNAGGAGRNIGATHAGSPYIAFADDDSWWAPGSLELAVRVLEGHPSVGLVAAAIRLGDEAGPLDPVCREMVDSPLPTPSSLPGPRVLGFVACASVVRREAFEAAGGFAERMGIGGEEELLAIDLADAGWDLVYVPDVVAVHRPSPRRDTGARRRRITRNALWTAWLRRRPLAAARVTARLMWAARRDRQALVGALDALRQLPAVGAIRRPTSARTEQELALLQR